MMVAGGGDFECPLSYPVLLRPVALYARRSDPFMKPFHLVCFLSTCRIAFFGFLANRLRCPRQQIYDPHFFPRLLCKLAQAPLYTVK